MYGNSRVEILWFMGISFEVVDNILYLGYVLLKEKSLSGYELI